MTFSSSRLSLAAALLLGASQAVFAVEPVESDSFNFKSDVDMASVTPENFYDLLVPAAKAAGAVSFYDSGETETELYLEIFRRFTEKYGIPVEYHQVNGEQAVQQLIAAHKAGRPSPADAMFILTGTVRTANQEGILANLPLGTMLPSAPALDQNAANYSRGYYQGGVVVPFHRNLTAIGYDTRSVQSEEAPKTFAEILDWAKAHPGKFGFTDPSRGGSGGGFVESAMIALMSEDCAENLYDFDQSVAEAEAFVEGECMTPVMDYFEELAPFVEFTNSNTDTLNLLANGEVTVATVWESQVYDYIGRGVLPPAIKSRLLTSGQVGDGDGLVILADGANVAGATLLMDFAMSDEIQLYKMQANGSRSARTTLDIDSQLGEDVTSRLVPSAQYAEFARPRIYGAISSAATDRFVADVLRTH